MHDALLGLDRTPPSLEGEGPCHDADGERADRLGDLGDDRSRTGTGATPLASRDEDHVGALQRLLELGPVGLSRLEPDFRVPTGPQTPGEVPADVQLDVGIAHEQCLCIGVDGDELDALEAGVDHPVDGVHSSAADPDDLDHCQIVLRITHHRCRLDPSFHLTRATPIPSSRG